MAELFGFEIRRKPAEEQQQEQRQRSFAPESNDDGAVVVAAGGAYGTYVDMEGSAKNEAELVNKYRSMAQQPEVDKAIDDIVNEAIVIEPNNDIVKINLDRLQQPDRIKKLITQEFDGVLKLLNFNNQAYDLFRRWYVDGRMYYHIIIDEKDVRAGIKELRYIDPRKIRKVRELRRKKDQPTQATLVSTSREYYIYNDKGLNTQIPNAINTQYTYGTSGLKIAKDSILHVTSGIMDVNNTLVLSYLHKAIKPLNQLRTLEDATIIYKVSRAPERRIFYIDVGNLPKMKAEQYLKDMMTRHKNRVVYDSSTGEIRDDRKFMTMLEDYWLPRREGNRGTEIATLPPGQLSGEMNEVEYFKKSLYEALGVPPSRMSAETAFNMGRSTEISRDEVKFAKLITRLRTKFSSIFLKTLEKQLILKGIITKEDWVDFNQDINFDYTLDNFFSELKEVEIIRERMSVLKDVDMFAGRYYSHEWIRKNILRQSDEEMEELDQQIESEGEIEQYQRPEEGEAQQELPPEELPPQGQQ